MNHSLKNITTDSDFFPTEDNRKKRIIYFIITWGLGTISIFAIPIIWLLVYK